MRRWPCTYFWLPFEPFCPSPEPAEPRRLSGEAPTGDELPFCVLKSGINEKRGTNVKVGKIGGDELPFCVLKSGIKVKQR